MPELTDDLTVGNVRFHKGASLALVQTAIDRLYAKYVEADTAAGNRGAPKELPSVDVLSGKIILTHVSS